MGLSRREQRVRTRRPWGFWDSPRPLGKSACPYNSKGWDRGSLYGLHSWRRAVVDSVNLGQVHRGRVVCPLCGRRLWGWVSIGHDADFYGLQVPPHKRKKWWKK